MGRGLARRILEGILKRQEDFDPRELHLPQRPKTPKEVDAIISDLEELKTRTPDKASLAWPGAVQELIDHWERVRSDMGVSTEDSGLQMYATEPPGAMGEEMEFTIDESSSLDENEWMSLDEMELECVECAGKMRDRKMTRILRREAEACVAKYGKKECGPTPDDEG